jgi:putative ABC transport system substrate-binding protein
VEVIVTAGTPAAQAVKKATTSVPLVMVAVGDPVDTGLVASLAKPGGNITGIADFHAELDPKRLELLKAVVPGAVKVTLTTAHFGPPGTDMVQTLWGKEMAKASEALRIRLSTVYMDSPAAFDKVKAAIAADRPHAWFVSPTPLSFKLRKEIADFAIAQRLPTVGSPREMAYAGLLLTYGSDLLNSSVKAGTIVGKILGGANPGDIPIEQPDKFEIVINLNTAKALGLTVPRTLILQADELIT